MKSPGASVMETTAMPQLLHACGVLCAGAEELIVLIPPPEPPQAASANTAANQSPRRIRIIVLFMALLLIIRLFAPRARIFRLENSEANLSPATDIDIRPLSDDSHIARRIIDAVIVELGHRQLAELRTHQGIAAGLLQARDAHADFARSEPGGEFP